MSVFVTTHCCQKFSFYLLSDAIVIVQESQKYEIQQALDKIPLNIKLDFQTIPSDQDFGTADSLKHIRDK